jgi:hypothetical protein
MPISMKLSLIEVSCRDAFSAILTCRSLPGPVQAERLLTRADCEATLDVCDDVYLDQ